MSRQVRSARVSHRPPSFAVMLVALAIVFALAWMFFLRSDPAAPAPVVNGIQGTFAWSPGEGSVGQKGSFSAVASGNAGGASEPDGLSLGLTPSRSAYEASTRTESTVAGPGAPTYRHVVGEWPPVWRVATRSPLDYQGLAAVVRAAVEDGDETVGIKPVKDGERAVWRAAMTLGGKQIDLVVDQQTGIVTWYTDDTGTFTAEVDWASPPPAGQTYTLDAPEGATAETVGSADGYVDSPAAAGRAAGYDPLVSGLAPDGYGLNAVATYKSAFNPVAWLTDDLSGMPPAAPSEPVVRQLYTRGLSWFSAEQIGPRAMRILGDGLRRLVDSTAPGKLSFEQATLQYGALKGATASTWYQTSGPSLYASDARRAVFITGALTRQELIAFAEGLKPVGASASQ